MESKALKENIFMRSFQIPQNFFFIENHDDVLIQNVKVTKYFDKNSIKTHFHEGLKL